MKKLIITSIIFIISATFVYADGFSYSQKRKLKDMGYSNSDIRKIERGRTNVEPTYKYESYTGNKYKYDLSDPCDRIEYRLDIDAQLKDRLNMPINPGVKIDRGIGQYGGGLMDD